MEEYRKPGVGTEVRYRCARHARGVERREAEKLEALAWAEVTLAENPVHGWVPVPWQAQGRRWQSACQADLLAERCAACEAGITDWCEGIHGPVWASPPACRARQEVHARRAVHIARMREQWLRWRAAGDPMERSAFHWFASCGKRGLAEDLDAATRRAGRRSAGGRFRVTIGEVTIGEAK